MRILVAIVGSLLCVLPGARGDATIGSGAIAIVNEENDKFVIPSTDKHYTQGLHVTVLWPDERVPLWVNPMTWWPDLGVKEPIHKYGFRLGQDIYTPVNTETNVLLRNDRPYAGWLFVGLVRENRGTFAGNIPVLDHIEVDAGVVGPYARGSDSQVWFHGLIHVDEPRGWGNQLKNEPGVLLNYDRKFLLWDSAEGNDPFHLQLLPHFSINLGNIETSATLGTMLRFGYNFPNEFAQSSPARFGWYLFSGVEARAVGYNEFLDGNLYHESHSVAKEPVVIQLRAGLTVILHRVEFNWTYNYLNKEFKKQDKFDAYGSLNLTCHF